MMKVFILMISFLFGCSHRVEISPNDLAQQIKSYQESGEIEASHDGETFIVSREMEPQIFLKTDRTCSFWGGLFTGCDSELVGEKLEKIKVTNDTITFNGITPGKILPDLHEVSIDEKEILEAGLIIDAVPENWTPTLAFGLVVGGATQFIGYQMHWFPVDQLALDAGFAIIPHSAVFAGGGLRIRPFRFENILPFAGVATSWSHSGAVVDEDTLRPKRTRFLVGPRVGVDFEFFNRRFLLGVEFDLFYDIEKAGFIYDLENESTSDWKPYGGLNFAYQF